MMSILSDAVSEIRNFINEFKVDSFFNHPKAITKFQTAYKQLHSLLIWSVLIERGDFPEAQYGAHPKEGISDLSHAFVLTTFSLYKPARAMARSSIENVVRTIVAGRNGDYQTSSVYTLFDNATELLKEKDIQKKMILEIKSLYKELCKTVHSAHKDHLALRIPFEKALSYDEEQFKITMDLLNKSSSSLNKIMFLIFHEKINNLEHKNRDFILDSLPRSLKRAILD